ncbi:DinB family protein [Weeksella virosa]|uniref:DinB-like domain-containing protein n=1 Tax=Weeksella virosa (strain ATCC 43766 / DSM 16922 / JCM 21250 / CCUG 30538 / CDC 9751 / IAM 14551 / NBRC 16016 / NCTC 11634 / CL345/78) TaxID=865938 RepID=F0P2K1_WEEVC|nr:DinB family protein [Weeksella virosa]ADX67840.1 hypothetical protein Weevi_1131 [Weeksella virosa DSM 16922]VEH64533.1 DinB superfamily [Weeksella virosa]
MEEQIYYLGLIRKNIINELENHSLQQLLYIPVGFKNNIFWNAAHVLATQQLIMYYLTETKMYVDKSFIERYKKGTIGTTEMSEKEVEELIEVLEQTPKLLYKDYRSEKLAYYKPYSTSFGAKLESIEDAIQFNNIHEGIHFGYILALKKNIPF